MHQEDINMEEKKLTYKDAGVDTKEGERAVSLMKEHVKGTFNENVLTGLGSFGSLFNLDVKGMEQPVLVSGTDGVGTKLKIAFLMDKHDTVGIDCVSTMCCVREPSLSFSLTISQREKLKQRKLQIS